MTPDGYSLIEITPGAPFAELQHVRALPARVTLPDGLGECDFDKAGLCTDESAPRAFKLVQRVLDGPVPGPLERLSGYGAPVLAGGQVRVTRSVAPLPDAEAFVLIKNKASAVILARYPLWRQNNMTARAVELAHKGTAQWTVAEAAEVVALEAVWASVKAVRAHSDAMEAAYAAGSAVDLETGAIDGAGGWPA